MGGTEQREGTDLRNTDDKASEVKQLCIIEAVETRCELRMCSGVGHPSQLAMATSPGKYIIAIYDAKMFIMLNAQLKYDCVTLI